MSRFTAAGGAILIVAVLALTVSTADAAVIRIGPGVFTPEASVITFSEFPVGTNNPTYVLNTASLGVVTVTFDGWFLGQAGGGSPVTLIDTTPTDPLTLDAASPNTFIATDGANPTSPVLSGNPRFNGVISAKFSTPVAAIGLDGGYFDATNSTTIEAYDANGNSLGSVTNNNLGIEFFGLADAAGQNVISGFSFYITGPEPAGFAIDNLTFGSAEEIIPEPGTVALMLLGVGALGIGVIRRRRR